LNHSRSIMALPFNQGCRSEESPALVLNRLIFRRTGVLMAFISIVMAISALPCFGQTNPPPEETVQQTNEKIQKLAEISHAKLSDSPIGAGDLLHIDVFDVPELTRDVRVSDLGYIGFPLIPAKIEAAGLTTFQLENKLEELLIENGLVSHPQVSVFVREQISQPVSVIGAVGRPMVYQILRATTLLEILAQAGGITDEAGSVVLVTRPTSAAPTAPAAGPQPVSTAPETQTMTIRIQDLLESGDPSYNIQIFGGDTISVPRAGIVYVMGPGIAQPGGYVVQSHGEQITVLKAVALAHGTTTFAKGDDAVILRNNPETGQRDEIPVHLKEIQKRKQEDVPMKSNDILLIPDNTGMKVLAKTAQTVLGVGTAIAVYRVGTQ
jgi:polysaccharide biosynthesis/export protein